MTFEEYQEQAAKTAIYPRSSAVVYPTIGLAGEVGELCNKIKKAIRGDYDLADRLDYIKKEMGGVLWYLAAIANDLHISLDEVAEMNIGQLQDRMLRNVIQGDGDDR
jgi:NTP pyrophosphatase (non-canonical NTP hydrolase)